MTNAIHDTPTPAFRVHARGPAFLRAAVIAALCTAFLAGFLAQVSTPAPTQAAPAASQIATCPDNAAKESC